MTSNNADVILSWCEDNSCGEPIRGTLGQKVPKFCLPCTVRRSTGVTGSNKQTNEPNELILGGLDYRQLRDSSDEENQD